MNNVENEILAEETDRFSEQDLMDEPIGIICFKINKDGTPSVDIEWNYEEEIDVFKLMSILCFSVNNGRLQELVKEKLNDYENEEADIILEEWYRLDSIKKEPVISPLEVFA